MESKILHRKLFMRTTWILTECGSDEADGSFTFPGCLGSHTYLLHVTHKLISVIMDVHGSVRKYPERLFKNSVVLAILLIVHACASTYPQHYCTAVLS